MNHDIRSESNPIGTKPVATTPPPICQGWQIERHLCLRSARSQAVLPQLPALESLCHNPVLVLHPLKGPHDSCLYIVCGYLMWC